MDSRTGEILADADYPTYDAADPADYPDTDRGARTLSEPYEPGSVEKVLTLSSLIDAGRMTARTKFTVPGSLARQDRVIHDYFEHGNIRLTLAGILAKSSNIGTVLAADRFKQGELRAYLNAFGLGPEDRARARVGVARHPARPVAVDLADRGPDRVRPGAVGHTRPDGRRGQHHRQRRRPRLARA